MKRRLNILCLLVFLVFCYPTFEMGRDFYYGFSEGMKMGMKKGGSDDKNAEMAFDFHTVRLIPKSLVLKDSVYNERTKSYVPVAYMQLIASVKVDQGIWKQVLKGFFSFLTFFALIASMALFVKLIISINKSEIFNWKNIRRLRWLGVALLLTFTCQAIPALMNDYELASVFSLSNYIMKTSVESVILVILGLVSFIVADVFALGLKMKEEQDLTI